MTPLAQRFRGIKIKAPHALDLHNTLHMLQERQCPTLKADGSFGGQRWCSKSPSRALNCPTEDHKFCYKNAPATKSAMDLRSCRSKATFGAVSASSVAFVAYQRNAQASRRCGSWRTTPEKSAMSVTMLLSRPQSWARWQEPGEVRRACFGELWHGSALSRDAGGSS